MNWDFLKEDFSGGEVSPKMRGFIGSDIYKAGLERMANAMPGRGRSAASRSGGAHHADGLANGQFVAGVPPVLGVAQPVVATAHEQRGSPVAHLPILDAPRGPVVLEIGPWYARLMDKTGPISWMPPFDFTMDGLSSTAGNGGWIAAGNYSDVWGDKPSATVYLNNSDGVGQRILSTPFMSNAEGGGGTPAGSAGDWNFYYRLAGDSVTLRLELGSGPSVDYVLTRGSGVVNFAPRTGIGVADTFRLRLIGPNNTVAVSALWDMRLVKNFEQFASPVFTASQQANLLKARVSQGFWSRGQFHVIVIGLDRLYDLIWTDISATFPGDRLPEWTFLPLNYVMNGPQFAVSDVSAVSVYQNRVWFGMSDAKGTLLASEVGYGYDDPNFPTTTQSNTKFVFGRVQNDYVGDGVKNQFRFQANAGVPGTGLTLADMLRVTLAGAIQPPANYTVAPFYDADHVLIAEDVHFTAGPPGVGQAISIRRADNLIVASDPMDLTLATPLGRIVWLAVLHGLVLGSTRAERTFSSDVLSIDPATGGTFELLEHSMTGSDAATPALPVNEKILFMVPGRNILRSMTVRFLAQESGLPQNGLVSEDISALGEHLLKANVRSLCYLKSPVERLVFAFDDGTGAMATMTPHFGLTWSRFTIPVEYGGIFSVCGLDVTGGSELYVGTESGITLRWSSVESDITHKSLLVPAAWPAQPSRMVYDDETPLPPVMDGWERVPLFRGGADVLVQGVNGGAGVSGRAVITDAMVGKQAWLLLAGRIWGKFTISTNGAGQQRLEGAGTALTAAGFSTTDGFTWTGADGKRRAGECYVGLAYPEHSVVTLPLEGGNPRGTAQSYKSRKPQLYLRLVDSYVPTVNGNSTPERDGASLMDLLGQRLTGDYRFTELGFTRGAVVDVEMAVPLRMEFSAMFGGTQTSSM
jgi:hypothetical protein